MLPLCFTVKLQNCSVDHDTSPDFISSGGGEEDLVFIFIVKLSFKSVIKNSHSSQTLSQIISF